MSDDHLTFEARVIARLEERSCPSEASSLAAASRSVSMHTAFLLGAVAGASAVWWWCNGVPADWNKSAPPGGKEGSWPTS